MSPLADGWAHCLNNHNVITIYPLGKWPFAPSEQSSEAVSELIPIIEEDHLDIGGEAGHMMAHGIQEELVHSILGQRC